MAWSKEKETFGEDSNDREQKQGNERDFSKIMTSALANSKLHKNLTSILNV